MKTRLAGALALFFCSSSSVLSQSVTGPAVQFQTSVGNIDVILLPETAPLTVANFLNYVNRGSYNTSLIHRSVPGFIVQGGGYRWVDRAPVEIPSDPPVRNEFSVSNTRGTLAMAKLGDDPNSATNQWFFNLANNSANLNNQNGGFTVFGRVTNQASLTVMDRIAAQRVFNAGPPFDQLPLVNYTSGPIQDSNVILIRAIVQLGPTPSIRANGIATASSFGAFASAAPGSFIEIYGSNLAGETSREWTTADFTNGAAPTSLDQVSVTIGGQSAYVSYVSSGQVNVQVPANAPVGDTVPVVLTYRGQATPAVNLAIKPVVGGLLAPARFKVGDKQYVVAVRRDGTFVSNGSISGLPAAPAAPGETLVMYGVGFGPVSPSSTPIAGQVVEGTPTITTPVEIKIGNTVASIVYGGLAPGLVGLYQFNLTVPANVPAGDLPVAVTIAGEANAQTLYLPVRSAQ